MVMVMVMVMTVNAVCDSAVSGCSFPGRQGIEMTSSYYDIQGCRVDTVRRDGLG